MEPRRGALLVDWGGRGLTRILESIHSAIHTRRGVLHALPPKVPSTFYSCLPDAGKWPTDFEAGDEKRTDMDRELAPTLLCPTTTVDTVSPKL